MKKILFLSLCFLWFIPVCMPVNAQTQKTSSEDIRIKAPFRLMAHRGGVVDSGKNPENSLAALDEAIRRGYTGAEIDVRQSKDGKLFLYHNASFERDYDSKGKGAEMTWAEIQQLRPLKEGVRPPVTMEEYCRHAQGKLQDLMIDIKVREPSPEFIAGIERILTETGFMGNSYFIGYGEYFLGKGGCKITMLMREKDAFFEKYGDKTKDVYFLFAGVDELNGRTIKWAQDNGIQIMACANLPFRGEPQPDNIPNAGRNIQWLAEWGIVDYQIDSNYDIFFRE